jgi:ssRNA-specific RNase YbeY (16S rRNA maturation enzyme)
MAVEVYNKTKAQINLALVETVTKAFLKFYKKSKLDTVIVFIGDKEMQEMNKAYRHKDKVTDVLSFTEADNEEPDSLICWVRSLLITIKSSVRRRNFHKVMKKS